MVLVDSSIWIAEFRKPGVLSANANYWEIAICPPVLQEVLQGIRAERSYSTARATLLSVVMIEKGLSVDVFEEAAQIYRTGRMTGFTIRSPFDCLIAACAIRNGTSLLHSDRDFNTIARFTRLQSRYVAL